MKESLKFLNRKETKPILKLIGEQWGAEAELDYFFVKNNNNKIFIVSRKISEIEFERLRINSLGLYLGELAKDGFRLSIEGSQIIGPSAKKNIADINNDELRKWLKGEDLEKETAAEGYAILRHEGDFVGCGKVKENKILNFVPKARRVKELAT